MMFYQSTGRNMEAHVIVPLMCYVNMRLPEPEYICAIVCSQYKYWSKSTLAT